MICGRNITVRGVVIWIWIRIRRTWVGKGQSIGMWRNPREYGALGSSSRGTGNPVVLSAEIFSGNSFPWRSIKFRLHKRNSKRYWSRRRRLVKLRIKCWGAMDRSGIIKEGVGDRPSVLVVQNRREEEFLEWLVVKSWKTSSGSNMCFYVAWIRGDRKIHGWNCRRRIRKRNLAWGRTKLGPEIMILWSRNAKRTNCDICLYRWWRMRELRGRSLGRSQVERQGGWEWYRGTWVWRDWVCVVCLYIRGRNQKEKRINLTRIM